MFFALLMGTYLSVEIQQAIEKYATEYSIDKYFIQAVVEKESSGRPTVTNGNCIGLMQINPKWHQDRMEQLEVDDLFDIDGNIHVGCDYLYELFEEYEDAGIVLDLYNGNSHVWENAENGVLSSYAEWILTRSAELQEDAYKEEQEREKRKRKHEVIQKYFGSFRICNRTHRMRRI